MYGIDGAGQTGGGRVGGNVRGVALFAVQRLRGRLGDVHRQGDARSAAHNPGRVLGPVLAGMPLQPGLLQLVNRVTGAARRPRGRAVRFLAVDRAAAAACVGFGRRARRAGRRTRRRRGRWAGYGRGARCRADRWIQRADAPRAGRSHGSIPARRSRSWADRRHGALLLPRRLAVGLGQQRHRRVYHGRDRGGGRGDQRARLARSRQHRRAYALKGQRLRFLGPPFLAHLQGDRLAGILGQRGGRRFPLGRARSLDPEIERLRLEGGVQLRLRVLHRLAAGLLVGARVMGGMRDGPGERRRSSGRRGAVEGGRRQFGGRHRARVSPRVVDGPAVRGRWQGWRRGPVVVRHLLVRRATGLRGERYRGGDRRLRGPAHRGPGHDPGIRFPVDVWRRRAADFRLRAGRRGVMRGRRRRGRMRMRVRIRGLGSSVGQARLGPGQITGLGRRRVRRLMGMLGVGRLPIVRVRWMPVGAG